MHLKYCSLTGADDAVDIQDLSALAAQYPFFECAVLLQPESAGKPRFPLAGWIVDFARDYKGKHRAMHLCGGALLGFVRGDREILRLMSGFGRIQLNLKFGDVEGKYDPAALAARVRETPEKEFILQYAEDKKGVLPLFAAIPNHALLFDASAGRGVSPDHWPAPLPGHFCGYAGGITPDNVKDNLEMIAAVVGDGETWIDMESGVRTQDRFDLQKARRVLEIAEEYL